MISFIFCGVADLPSTLFKIQDLLNLKATKKLPIMDEKSSKSDFPHFEHVLPAKTELDEAINPDAPPRRQAIGINIVENPLTVSHN